MKYFTALLSLLFVFVFQTAIAWSVTMELDFEGLSVTDGSVIDLDGATITHLNGGDPFVYEPDQFGMPAPGEFCALEQVGFNPPNCKSDASIMFDQPVNNLKFETFFVSGGDQAVIRVLIVGLLLPEFNMRFFAIFPNPVVYSSAFMDTLFFATAANAQSGEVVEVTQPAVLVVEGERLALAKGDLVNVGDTILTGRGAKALVVFPDHTRIVVGPRSQLKIDRLLFRDNTTARRFAVSAAKGTFRFLSGNSSSRAYSVRTPIATMGVRGTAFDFAIPTAENTDLVVYDGLVQFCQRGNPSCARVPRGCHTVRMERQKLTQPATEAERKAILDGSFPFASRQNVLRQEFRTSTRDCEGNSNARIAQIRLPPENPVIRHESQESTQPPSGNPAE